MAESILPISADYTDKDFDSANRRLDALLESVFPTWTDYSRANFGNILKEMFAFCVDVLGFYQDNQAIESRITTAAQRKNLLALVKLINYEPATATAAQCLVKITCTPPPPSGDPVVLGGIHNPFPIVVKTGDGEVKYELQQTVSLTSSIPTRWALVENSESHTESFASTGFLGQEIRLAKAPYLDGSAILTAANGGYLEVASFLESTATDRHFTVHVDNTDTAIIRFGNQISGQLPSGTITVSYKTGGGSRANVEKDAITKIEGSFRTNSGLPVNLTVINDGEPAGGGLDRESEAQIREKAPLSLRVLTRAVAREDFEILAQKFGMARALLLTSSEDPNIPINTGFLYLIPPVARGQTVTFPTAAKQDEILRRIRTDYPYSSTFEVKQRTPVFLDVAVRARVYLRRGYSGREALIQATAALKDYFALYNADGSTNRRVDFGYYYESGASDGAKVVPLSDLFDAVRDCDGIHRMGVNQADFTVGVTTDSNSGVYGVRLTTGSHSDIPIQKHEFPRFHSLVLIDGATGAPIPPEV